MKKPNIIPKNDMVNFNFKKQSEFVNFYQGKVLKLLRHLKSSSSSLTSILRQSIVHLNSQTVLIEYDYLVKSLF